MLEVTVVPTAGADSTSDTPEITPEVIEEFLEYGQTKCVSFNRKGTLLAAGCQDGRIVVWDFITRGVARVWEHHKAAVSSLSWSRNGRYLLSSSLDSTLLLWDVEAGRVLHRLSLPSEVVLARMHPQDPFSCVACGALGPPLLAELRSGATTPLPVMSTLPGETNRKGPDDGQQISTVAAFSKDGSLCYVATSRGTLNIVDISTRQVAEVLRVPGGHRVTGMSVSRRGTHVALVSFDRVVRVYDVAPRGGALSLAWELSNAVDKTQWKGAAVSPDGRHVAAAASSKAEHQIFIWSRETGKLVRVLEGPKEGMAALAWHPTKPALLCSVSAAGSVFVWARTYAENWSAFAPDFKELAGNEEYVEREDEFDILEGVAAGAGPGGAGGEGDEAGAVDGAVDEEVDILSVDPPPRRPPGGGAPELSDSEGSEDDCLHYLPVSPARDEGEGEGGGAAAAAAGTAEGGGGEEDAGADGGAATGGEDAGDDAAGADDMEGDEDEEGGLTETGRMRRKAKRTAEQRIKEEAAIKTGKRAKFLCPE